MDNDIIHSIKEIMENIQQNCEKNGSDGSMKAPDSGKKYVQKNWKARKRGNNMKKKIALLTGILLAICVAAGTLVSADTDAAYLGDLDAAEREKIIANKEADQAVVLDSQGIDYTNKETMFASFGFTEDDLRPTDLTLVQTRSNSVSNTAANKEYIYDRMLNTIDFYDTLQGSFEFSQAFSNLNYTATYCVRSGEDRKSFESILYEPDSASLLSGEAASEAEPKKITAYFDGQTKTEKEVAVNVLTRGTEETEKVLRTAQIDVEEKEACDFVSLIRAGSRVTTDEEGINTYYYRENLNGLGYCRESIDPQELAIGYLRNFDTWDITGEEVVAGRNCLVLEGELSGFYSEKRHTAEFKLWVDRETGILMKSEHYDADGNLSESLTTTSITVNAPVTDETFLALGCEF